MEKNVIIFGADMSSSLHIDNKMFIVLLSNIINGSNHTKCISLSNQKCIIQPTLINLHSKEYSQEFHYYPFAVKLTKHLSSECKCRLDGKNVTQINSGITINVDVTVKNIIYVKKIILGFSLHLASIMVDSAIACDEIIETEETKFQLFF